MLRIRLTALALVLSAGLAQAGIENAGTTAGNFLSVGTGAGILSMGGATLGAGRDLNAAAWNPATIGFLSSSQYALSHSSLALDVSQDWIAGSGSIGRSQTRWAASALYQNDGTFDGRDAFGAPTGSFNVSNLALGLAVARPFTPDLTAGARFHYVNESLGSTSGSGLAMDLGVQARHGALGFGAAARNLGGKMKYDAGSFDLPSVFGLGASWSDETRGLRFALDANFPRAYYNDVRFGGEWNWQQRVALRAGYRLELGGDANEPLGGPSFGLGTGVNGLWFDYAFLAGANQAQGSHRFGLTFHPSFFQKRAGVPMAGETTDKNQAPVAAVTPAEPRSTPKPAPKPSVAEPKPAPKPEPPVAKPTVVVPDDASASQATAREVAPAQPKLEPSKSVKVPRLAKPEVAPAPVAVVTPPAAKPEPVAAKPPALPAPAPVAVVTPPAPRPEPVVAKPEPVAARPSAPAPVAVVTPPAPKPEPDHETPAPVIAKVASSSPTVVVVKPAHKTEPRPAQVTIQKGETLADVAKRWGTSVPAIMMENNMVSSHVKPGQKVKLPKR